MKRNLLVALILLLPVRQEIHAQEDSVGSAPLNEELLEQAGEDSPIIDLVSAGYRKNDPEPAIAVRSRISRRFQEAKGFTDASYAGSSLKSYQRMLLRLTGGLSGGILFTKDPGEQRFNDFNSWNLAFSNAGWLQKAVAGDFRIEAGQGVSLWRGYDFSKGGEVISPAVRRVRGLVSSLSTDEVNYFRGLAVSARFGSLSLLAFWSNRHLGASIDSSGEVTSLYGSGYFRTKSEQARRDVLSEKLYCMRSTIELDGTKVVGVTLYRTAFSARLSPGGAGTGYSLAALDYKLSHLSITLFGEWAISNSVIGGISGVLLAPSQDITLVASVRSYPDEFVSLHGLAFGERTGTSNELG
ncbi:MAG TPA: hypothetical protein VGR15_04220, partial [Bacteroidota bacterium]|nr:hypothetical protein [Bacteroidota bacterium]